MCCVWFAFVLFWLVVCCAMFVLAVCSCVCVVCVCDVLCVSCCFLMVVSCWCCSCWCAASVYVCLVCDALLLV